MKPIRTRLRGSVENQGLQHQPIRIVLPAISGIKCNPKTRLVYVLQ